MLSFRAQQKIQVIRASIVPHWLGKRYIIPDSFGSSLNSNARTALKLDIYKALEEEPARKQYQEKVTEYLADHKIDDIEEFWLEQLREDLGLSVEEAEEILKDEQVPIKQAKQAYTKKLTALIARGWYPFSEENRKKLKEFQNEKNLTDEELEEIAKPILEAAEVEYQEKLR